ncbi:MAG TPA: helicase HerA-like domain-containing protein, partial [Allosphingosinicella sp.]
WTLTAFPVEFLSLGGLGPGVPVRATMTDFGPTLLAKVLDLNATQESSLGLVFRYADDAGLPLLDLKDLRAVISWLVSDEGKPDLKGLGGLSASTAGVLLRELIGLEELGGDVFFGEPAWEPADLMRTAADGRGVISAVELPAVQDRPALFSTFLMWLLAELFEDLPEVGDLDKPKLVFFFDEAHLLFTGASKAFLESVTQTVRLIRSKGVGIFFVTQNPIDIPAEVAGQLGTRIQHALRAYTPRDQRAIKAAAETFRVNPKLDVETAITELKVGEALVSVLQEDGSPSPVERTLVKPPRSRLGPLTERERAVIQSISPAAGKYEAAVDRESAEEILKARTEAAAAAAAADKSKAEAAKQEAERLKVEARQRRAERADPSFQDQMVRQVGKAVQRQVVNRIAGQLVRGLLGGLFKGR